MNNVKFKLLLALKTCKDLQNAKKIHAAAIESKEVTSTFVASALINVYARCSSMLDARLVFDNMKDHDVVSWNALMFGYVENGEHQMSLEKFAEMRETCAPDARSFVAVLKACMGLAGEKADILVKGRAIHCEAACHGFDSESFVANSLISMYSKSGCMAEARKVFAALQSPQLVSWTALIMGYAENGDEGLALELVDRMKSEGCSPGSRTYVAALKACTSLAIKEKGLQVDGKTLKVVSLRNGRDIHFQTRSSGFELDNYVASSLIDMYAKCGVMSYAQDVFDRMEERCVVCWNTLLQGYAENGEGEKALELFANMTCAPNARTVVAALKACTSLAKEELKLFDEDRLVKARSLKQGMVLHSLAERNGFLASVFVTSTLVDMYAKCGSMVHAWRAFDRIKSPGVVAWTALALGYAENGDEQAALDLFGAMKSKGCAPNALTYFAALKACAGLAAKEEAEQVEVKNVKKRSMAKGVILHEELRELGYESETLVMNGLIDMYSRCGDMVEARKVFDKAQNCDVFSWTAIISGYTLNKEGHSALEVFFQRQPKGCKPNAQTFIAALKACSALALEEEETQVEGKLLKVESLKKGISVHSQAIDSSWDSDIYVANTLVGMYMKCGSLTNARKVFEGMNFRNSVSWTALILGYAENGEGEEALRCFASMQIEGCTPDALTFVAALKSCGLVTALNIGKEMHADILWKGLEKDAKVLSSLVDFYGRCGSMTEAQNVFDSEALPKNLVTWNALLAGYSRQCDVQRVFDTFSAMKDQGIEVDGITFSSVLIACGHAGLIDKAKEYFEIMISKHGIVPDVDHYICMVDILGRAHKLEDALALVRSMPCNLVAWRTLLNACIKWKNVSVGKFAYDSLLELDGKDPLAYVLMSNLNATSR